MFINYINLGGLKDEKNKCCLGDCGIMPIAFYWMQ